MRAAMIVLSDAGQTKMKRSVALNDMRAISELYKLIGYDVRILYREDLENVASLSDYDSLFIFYGGLINFGGKQSENAIRVIQLINEFPNKVVVFGNDVMDPINNKIREGFERITRPVIYASPDGIGGSETGAVDLEVSDEVEINQSFMIGKHLASLPDVAAKPMYDVVYGGRDRPAMRRRLQKVAQSHSLLTYSKISKSLEDTNAASLNSKYLFDNAQLRVINSLGKYSLMLEEKRKKYFTSRVFEQLFSNSIVLFDKGWPTLKEFWRSDNTFDGSVDDLLVKLDAPYNEQRVAEQHEMARNFNYDKYINQEAEALARILS